MHHLCNITPSQCQCFGLFTVTKQPWMIRWPLSPFSIFHKSSEVKEWRNEFIGSSVTSAAEIAASQPRKISGHQGGMINYVGGGRGRHGRTSANERLASFLRLSLRGFFLLVKKNERKKKRKKRKGKKREEWRRKRERERENKNESGT